jgi:hypothetical protein
MLTDNNFVILIAGLRPPYEIRAFCDECDRHHFRSLCLRRRRSPHRASRAPRRQRGAHRASGDQRNDGGGNDDVGDGDPPPARLRPTAPFEPGLSLLPNKGGAR